MKYIFAIVIYYVSLSAWTDELQVKQAAALELDKSFGLTDVYHIYDFVAYTEVVQNLTLNFKDNVYPTKEMCAAKYTELKIIESFKGPFKRGQIIRIEYPDFSEYSKEHSRQITFFRIAYSKDIDLPCDIQHKENGNFLIASTWCCVIVQKNGPYVLIDNRSDPKYLIKADDFLNFLRRIK